MLAALLFDLQQSALDRADAGRRHVAVLRLELRRVVADELQHGAQIGQVQQQQPVVVSNLEYQCQHAFLRLVEIQQAREQLRPHVGNGRAHRMALLAEHVPQRGGAAAELRLRQPELLQARAELVIHLARLGNPGQVSFDVGEKHRHADPRELLGHHLQRDGFSGARRAGDASVAVGERGKQGEIEVARFGNYERLSHGGKMGVVPQ